MSEEEINVAIAECLGWTGPFEKCWLYGYGREGEDVWAFCGTDADGERDKLPNYCGDLNAMHEAMSILDYEQADEFDDHLCDICKRANDIADNPTPWRFAVTNAAAIQRAEAYLRTLGKWIE